MHSTKLFLLSTFFIVTVFLLTSCTAYHKPVTAETFVQCLALPDHGEFIINSAEELEQLAQYRHNAGRCANSTFPRYDFDRLTLLGKIVEAQGCSATFDKRIIWDEENNVVTYTIIPKPVGDCQKMKIIAPNWMLVEKIPSDHTVTFIVQQQEKQI